MLKSKKWAMTVQQL